MFSETLAEVLREVRSIGCEWDVFFSHSRPIPDCFNEPVTAALRWGASHVWVVEEDMILPEGVLTDLIAAGAPFAVADYPVRGGMSVHRDGDGAVMWAGTGCLFADANAMRDEAPFTAEFQFELRGGLWVKVPASPGAYGLHDIEFGLRLHTRGEPLHVIDRVCGQRYVARPAAVGTNVQGWHDVRELGVP